MKINYLSLLRTKKTWFILLAIAALIFTAFRYDATFRAWMIATQGSDWKYTPEHAVFAALSKYGDWPELIGITALAAVIAWKLKRPEWTKILVAALIASALAGTLAASCRSLTGRTRPSTATEITPGWYGPYHNGQILIGKHSYNSFPSGHTATAIGLATVILLSRPRWGIPCMLIALSIAASRLYLGQHHLSDVIVSCILGVVVGWLVWENALSKRVSKSLQT